MKESLPTTLGLIFKKITGVKDISLMKKNIHKNIGRLFYHKKYTVDDIIKQMCRMGMKKGSVVCIHSAMKEFYNFKGTANELISAIINVLTDEGTLIMPAYPDPINLRNANYIFNPLTEPTKAGYLAETFRTYPGVYRSINVQHSVCAWGKYARWLTFGHQNCINCWDENSPWYKMTRISALVFTLGLPYYYIGTFDHCVEGLLYKEHPYWAQFFREKRIFRYLDNNNGTVCKYTSYICNIERRTHERVLIKYFGHDLFVTKKISNLLIKVFHSKECLDEMIKLGRCGITMYYVPSPKKYKF